MKLRLLKQLVLASVASLSLVANAQTLTLTNGVQKYASLTSTTVNMSGRCELWVTNAATPLSGCTINLNSIDAWLFLPNVKPSVVASTYLGQMRVSGASAVADSNVRVVQYGQNGAVVIPQASTFQPLTVFTGAEFTGAATSYSQWTYYTGTAYTNISSFKLKRGYQAVLAQSANGANYSKCYVAQDGDLEIGVLPATLANQVQFIYVTPWRWTSKKGIAGNPPYSDLNVNWWYDWNIDSSSSRDLEYVAIHQLRYWPGMNQNWQSLGINTVLGYNEPDNTAQANIAVGDAFWSWPDLLGTGLRVGSPACTDGGVSSWLLPFMTDIATSQANEDNAPGLRVDFVAQHYYQSADPSNPSACASQMYNFLLNIWNNTHLPIWVTEWNNGANWTDGSPYAAPTYAQQQADIQAMTQMLESTPFVERYALYNWVEDTRSLVTSSNTVTPAGTTYSNLVSAIGYSQAMPDNGTRGIAEFLFATNTWDTSGYYNNGMAIGAPNYSTGHISQAQSIVLDGANSYVQLPANIAEGGAFTFAAWVYWNGGNNWQRIFDFGNPSTSQGGTPSQYMFLTPSSGSGLRFVIDSGSGEQVLERSGALASGSWQHVAVTLSNNVVILYVNGAQVASSTSFSITPASFSPIKNYLGKSQFAADPLFNGNLDEVEIADYAMTPAQISALYSSASPVSGGIWTTNASGYWGTNNNWSGGIVANGTGFIADFSTITITASRTVTLDSARTIGGLKFGTTTGSQSWTLAGANTLTLDAGGGNVPVIAVNQNTATISTPLSGSYGFTKTGGGALTLSGANTYTGATTVSAGVLNVSGAGQLNAGAYAAAIVDNGTFAYSSSASQVLSGAISGTGGMTVNATNGGVLTLGSGAGSLMTYTGPTIVDGGELQLNFANVGNSYGIAASSGLIINNGASVVLMNDNSLAGGNFVVGSVPVTINAGGVLTGSDTVDGGAGSSAHIFGLLTLNGGTLANGGTGAQPQWGTWNLDGGVVVNGGTNTSTMSALDMIPTQAGGTIFSVTNGGTASGVDLNVTGTLINGTSMHDTGIILDGNGTMVLSGANTYAGQTIVSNGTLLVNGSLAAGSAVTVASGALGGVGSIGGATTVNAGGYLVPGINGVGTLTFTNNLTLNAASTNNFVVTANGASNNVAVTGTLTPNGSVIHIAAGTALGLGTNTLFTCGTISGAFNATPVFDVAQNNVGSIVNDGAGHINLVMMTGVNTNPATANFAASVAGSAGSKTLNFTWAPDHQGWQLYTNAVGLTATGSWFPVLGSASVTNESITVDSTKHNVFFQLRYP